MNKLAAFGLTTGLALALAAGPAQADSGEGVGKAFGKVGCQLANGDEYKSPGHMLQYLSERDGTPKATVNMYPNHFESVGDLINKKCGN